jgi:uncharacterized protein (TIGR03067 family)
VESGLWDDLLPLLDQELAALPERFRLPIVLCDLEGMTRKEATRTLDWPERTVAGRLAQARAMLAKRLMRRGLPISAGILTALLPQKAAAASLPTALTANLATASGSVSAKASGIADAVLKSMLIAKLKSATMFVTLLAALMLMAIAARGDTDAVVDSRADEAEAQIDRRIDVAQPAQAQPQVEKELEAELKKLQGTWSKSSLEIDGRPNALFANVEPYYVFKGTDFSVTDHYGNVEKKGRIKLVPSAHAIDLNVTHGGDKGKRCVREAPSTASSATRPWASYSK